MILFDGSKCVSCNSCIRTCPVPEANKAVITESGKTIYSIDQNKCIRCGACLKACRFGALRSTFSLKKPDSSFPEKETR